MKKDKLLKALKKISDVYFDKKDYISAGQVNRAMDVVEDMPEEEMDELLKDLKDA